MKREGGLFEDYYLELMDMAEGTRSANEES
jgi:hypothetical protein